MDLFVKVPKHTKYLKHFLFLPDWSLVPKISEIKLMLLSFVMSIPHQTSSFYIYPNISIFPSQMCFYCGFS